MRKKICVWESVAVEYKKTNEGKFEYFRNTKLDLIGGINYYSTMVTERSERERRVTIKCCEEDK